MNSLEDHELIEAIRTGNDAAFSALVLRHAQRFHALALRTLQSSADAEEVLQLAFLKVWQQPQKFDSSKARFTTWFYRVVLNLCKDAIKRNARSSECIADYVQECLVVERQQADDVQQTAQRSETTLERRVALEYAIARLGSQQRDALNLALYSDLKQAEAASVMGVSLKAFESIVHRAKKQLARDVQSLKAEGSGSQPLGDVNGATNKSVGSSEVKSEILDATINTSMDVTRDATMEVVK